MFEIYEHNKSDCIKLLNMIICEIPFIKSFSDECLLERLLNLISIITNAFENPNYQSLDSNVFDTEEERETAIREWLLRHYSAKCQIDDLNFNDSEDRAKVTVLIINIIFKLRHSLKDIEQYLKDCDSFVQFDIKLKDITRFDKLLEIVENDCNRWKSESRHYKLKYDESRKLIDKYQQNEIFNYNCNPRNQNLYKSRISLNKDPEESSEPSLTPTDQKDVQNCNQVNCECHQTSAEQHIKVINRYENQIEAKGVNNTDVNYLCIDCDKSYSTKFEYNLHVLKDHKNFDISQIVCNSMDFNNSNNINESTKPTKKCRHMKKRVFKCSYNKCGKSFHKLNDLKTHFIRHQPKINKLLYVYDYTNAVLNNLRAASLKAIRFSTNCENKPKKIKFNSNLNKSIKFNIDLNVDNYGFTNGFGIDSHLNHSKDIQTGPLCQTERHFSSDDSFDFVNQSTDERIDSTRAQFFSHLDHNSNLNTYSNQ